MQTFQTKYSGNKFWDNILYHNHFHHEPTGLGVAVLGAEPNVAWRTDVKDKLIGTGLMVDDISVINSEGGSTPTLAELRNYFAVLVYSDGNFLDSNTLGDNLAAYVDGGDGVVLDVFTGSVRVGGNWNTGDYDAIGFGSVSLNSTLTLGTVFHPEHPVMAGVSSFNGGTSSYHNTGAPTANTIVIANWSNGQPLVIEKLGKNGKIIFLNFFPPSSDVRGDLWVSSTDGALLMSNALQYVKF